MIPTRRNRSIPRRTALVMFSVHLASFVPATAAPDSSRRPNVLLILADDLGSGELGCYGQRKIETPRIDALAREGVRFTTAYSAAPVCAPSRCALLSGRDMGHAAIRDNHEIQPDGQLPLPPEVFTLAESLKEQGYATACIGKWGLGMPEGSGSPLNQGFDRFYGYACQRHAHDHYPRYLYSDRERVDLEPGTYAPDRFLAESLGFLEQAGDRPFFLMFATTVPHLALQVPEDSLEQYRGKLEDAPYDGKRGYRAHETPHAAYAAMVTRFDRDVGTLIDALDARGIAEDTIVIVTSDNGATFDLGGADTPFFAGNGGLRGHKGQLYEGGIRVPFIVRWKDRIPGGRVDVNPIGHVDLFPTLASLCGAKPPNECEGLDLSRTWIENEPLPERTFYFEHASGGGWRAVRQGDWKLVVRGEKRAKGPIERELFDLASDPNESKDRLDAQEIRARLERALESRTKAILPAWEF